MNLTKKDKLQLVEAIREYIFQINLMMRFECSKVNLKTMRKQIKDYEKLMARLS
jgi:hypothetical protein